MKFTKLQVLVFGAGIHPAENWFQRQGPANSGDDEVDRSQPFRGIREIAADCGGRDRPENKEHNYGNTGDDAALRAFHTVIPLGLRRLGRLLNVYDETNRAHDNTLNLPCCRSLDPALADPDRFDGLRNDPDWRRDPPDR